MIKKSVLTISFVFPVIAFITSQIPLSKPLSGFGVVFYNQNLVAAQNSLFSNYEQLSRRQLFDTARYYLSKNSIDTALIYYNLFLNMSVADTDTEQQQRLINAYNNSAFIYYQLCDYRRSYECLMQALLLCEKNNETSYQSTIYSNIGNIYSHFQEYDMAKFYYSKALHSCKDSMYKVVMLNCLGSVEIENGNIDSAYYFLNQSLEISKNLDSLHVGDIFNLFALLYQKEKRYDSALYYYKLSLDYARKDYKDHSRNIIQIEAEAECLSNLGKLFFEVNHKDSALFYINLSNDVISGNRFPIILLENYLMLSKIEKSRGNSLRALEYLEKYITLKDSIFNTKALGDINQLQRLYEISKTNEQFERLAIEQQIKERKIYYQKIIQTITWVVLFIVSILLLFVFLQKRRLNNAYKVLFEKNIEIMDLQKKSIEREVEKQTYNLTHDMQDELLNKILLVMENNPIIYDTKFSMDKLAELVETNHAYVSQVINKVFKKNFRSFLHEYRIKEAQRLFSEPDATKYTIESISHQVGFKSQSAFRDAFRIITGVSPNFYLKQCINRLNPL